MSEYFEAKFRELCAKHGIDADEIERETDEALYRLECRNRAKLELFPELFELLREAHGFVGCCEDTSRKSEKDYCFDLSKRIDAVLDKAKELK